MTTLFQHSINNFHTIFLTLLWCILHNVLNDKFLKTPLIKILIYYLRNGPYTSAIKPFIVPPQVSFQFCFLLYTIYTPFYHPYQTCQVFIYTFYAFRHYSLKFLIEVTFFLANFFKTYQNHYVTFPLTLEIYLSIVQIFLYHFKIYSICSCISFPLN